jgi:GntP family gluconate:H+ symporter
MPLSASWGLLLPLAKSVARRLQEGPIRLALALLAGLSAVHCLVPPHPGPLLAIHIHGADTGKTLLYGLVADAAWNAGAAAER